MRTIVWLMLLTVTAPVWGEDLLPWSANRDPTDVRKTHVQDITAGRSEYIVVQKGTMDGRNCRSPQGVWTPFEQTWESNRSVRIENVGETNVVNPWLSNGDNDFRNMDAIVARAVEPGMTDQEKATALWWQQIQFRFHYGGDNHEMASPVKVLNIYGHNTCGNDSICLAGLWKTAGLKVAPARLVGHCVTQVYYDGGWHLFDGDMHSMYLLRDNRTIAGEQDLVRDHDLIKRTHTQGILRPQGRAGDEWESSIYVFEGDVKGDRNADRTSTMNMTLRPGESLVWRWGHTNPVKYFGSPKHEFFDRVCNGLWEYQPDLTKPAWRAGAESVRDIDSLDDGLKAASGKKGEIVWSVATPYVLVGGQLESDEEDTRFELSWDGKNWQKVNDNFDALFLPVGTARYRYFLRCQLEGSARLRSLRIVNDLQMAPLSLPEMRIGDNQFTYSDQSTGERRVRITHEWVERSASKAPTAPTAPNHPRDGDDVEGTDVVFEWEPAVDPDGDKIADYHFELASRSDMRWPLSMSFAKLISRTSDAGTARYTLKAPGELNPDSEYYWHVRAKDAHGVWGDWSKTWRFTPRGPAPPQDLKLEYDATKNTGTLLWTPAPMGRPPVRYRIYASDEKGFSVSDVPYSVVAGVNDGSPQKGSAEFPANFVAETEETHLAVIGTQVTNVNANKAYFRVVAVDRSGKRSGPSDYASAPRPIIYSSPPAKIKVGEDYHYDILTIRSLGDLRTRVVDGREVMKYWDVEKPKFQIERGPTWLTVNPMTGSLSGKPDRAGRWEVTVSATLERENRPLDPDRLQWGIEKVIQTTIERVGTAKQEFVIEVE